MNIQNVCFHINGQKHQNQIFCISLLHTSIFFSIGIGSKLFYGNKHKQLHLFFKEYAIKQSVSNDYFITSPPYTTCKKKNLRNKCLLQVQQCCQTIDELEKFHFFKICMLENYIKTSVNSKLEVFREKKEGFMHAESMVVR